MARIRTIKPDFFKNEQICELTAMTRLLFIGLWTQADREGKLEDRPKRIKVEIFPYDNFDMEKGLNELQKAGLIFRYKVYANVSDRISSPEQPDNQVSLIKILTFEKHQQPNVKEAKSNLPEPKEPYKHCADTVQALQEGKGKERKGRSSLSASLSSDQTTNKISLSKSVETFEKRKEEFKQSLFPFTKYEANPNGPYTIEMAKEFFEYWSEPNKSRSKMRWESEKSWDLSLRLGRWARNQNTGKPKINEISLNQRPSN